jgi:hypothetical protein
VNVLHARCIGGEALRCLQESERATVFAVFERSCYVRTEEQRIACIGSDALPPGPLLARCPGWPSAAGTPRAQETLRREGQTLRFAHSGLAVSWSRAAVWTPAAIPVPALSALRAGLALLPAAAEPFFPNQGLAPLIPALLGVRPLPLPSAAGRPARALFLHEARRCFSLLNTWLADQGARGAADACARGATGLLGLGPGLTPAGDDALGGMLVALRLLQDHEACALLGGIIEGAPDATNAISRAHLRAAARGLAAAPLHDVLGLLCSGSPCPSEALRAVSLMGHSSGWDALTGALFVLARPHAESAFR